MVRIVLGKANIPKHADREKHLKVIHVHDHLRLRTYDPPIVLLLYKMQDFIRKKLLFS